MKENIVFERKVIRGILLHLNKKEADYVHGTARELGFSWASLSRNFNNLVKEGLIELIDKRDEKKYIFIHMNKRTKYYKLTEKGKRVSGLIIQLNKEVSK